MSNFSFRVIDNKTGKEADTYKIALKEDWAKGLMYCDMEGFAIHEDGHLLLLDECDNFAYCPNDRFTIIPEGSVVLPKKLYEQYTNELNNYEVGKRDGSKETAREILKLVDKKLDLYRNGVIGGSLYDDGYKSAVQEIKFSIKKLYGVEVEE